MALRGHCKHFEVCERAGEFQVGAEELCILHHPPGPQKNSTAFEEALSEHLQNGRSSFRWMYFPNAPSLENRFFANTVDFRDTAFPGMLNLNGVRVDGDLLLGGREFSDVTLSGATVRGSFRAEVGLGNTLRLFDAVIENSFCVDVASIIHIQAAKARLLGGMFITALQLASLDLSDAKVLTGLRLRSQQMNVSVPVSYSWSRARLEGLIDLRECLFASSLLLSDVAFQSESTLLLSQARVVGDVIIAGSSLPHEIALDGTTIQGALRVEAVLGNPRPRLVAIEQPPKLDGLVTLINVNLRDCRLLGNAIASVEFSRVEWPNLGGRYVLRDEIVLRHDGGVPPDTLREAYQSLKEMYKTKGDNVLAGDFHYGEMEMKRREYPHLQRWLGWEAWYWALSGYGMRPLRAFAVLACLVVIFGAGYAWLDSQLFDGSFLGALRFSLSVATLQRPDIPQSLTNLGQWLYRFEAIVCPVQAALFGLALRMRLRR